ncbi:unnamed protein product, partial [Mesorhabditis spiculigera]
MKTSRIYNSLTSKATAHQEYYYTKVQRQVYFTTSINLFVSLICVFVEIFIWCATNHSVKLFPWSRIHPYLVGLFFFLNLFFHCILLLGARKLSVMTLRNYILLQGFFGLMAMSLIVVLTAVNLKNHGAGIEGYGILLNRFFFAGLSFSPSSLPSKC